MYFLFKKKRENGGKREEATKDLNVLKGMPGVRNFAV